MSTKPTAEQIVIANLAVQMLPKIELPTAWETMKPADLQVALSSATTGLALGRVLPETSAFPFEVIAEEAVIRARMLMEAVAGRKREARVQGEYLDRMLEWDGDSDYDTWEAWKELFSAQLEARPKLTKIEVLQLALNTDDPSFMLGEMAGKLRRRFKKPSAKICEEAWRYFGCFGSLDDDKCAAVMLDDDYWLHESDHSPPEHKERIKDSADTDWLEWFASRATLFSKFYGKHAEAIRLKVAKSAGERGGNLRVENQGKAHGKTLGTRDTAKLYAAAKKAKSRRKSKR